MIWNVLQFTQPGNLASATLLGRVRADHHPAAMLRAFAKWPKVPQGLISARPKKGDTRLAGIRP